MSAAAWLTRRAIARASRWSFGRATARGRFFGRVAWALDSRHRKVAMANLRRVFPERDAAWHRSIARASFEQAGRTITELLWSPNLSRVGPEAVARLEHIEHVRAALESGRGALIVSAHFGNWELMALLLGQAGIPLVSIARPLDDAELDGLLVGLRSSTGNGVLPKVNAVRGALRALRDNKAVAILVDQNTQRHEAVFVPFFGRLAATTPVVAHLHLRSGAPLLPTFVVPEKSGYRLEIEPPIEVTCEDRDEAVTEITARMTARIEHHVRAHPHAWLWMHDRWRERPEPDTAGERN